MNQTDVCTRFSGNTARRNVFMIECIAFVLGIYLVGMQPALGQFPAGTRIDISETDIDSEFEWKDLEMTNGSISVHYSRAGTFKVKVGAKVYILRDGAGILASLSSSEGIAFIHETITIGNKAYQREIQFTDGVASVSVNPARHPVNDTEFVDLTMYYPVLRSNRPVAELVKLLDDNRWQTLAGAVAGLQEMGAVKELISALKHSEGDVRYEAITALGKMKAKPAVSAVAALLRDELWTIRRRAAWALEQIHDPVGLPALVAALGSDNGNQLLQNQIGKALSAISGQNFGVDQSKWAEWLKSNTPAKR